MKQSLQSVAAPGGHDAVAGATALGERDMAELFAAFNDVTGRLQATHDALRAEVVRLHDELSQANEQLVRARRLAALGEMAAGISHEVRNPLGAIRLHARMLEQDLGDRPAERAHAEKILTAVRGLDSVVGDVLAFAKEMNVATVPARAGDLLEHALEECLAGVREEERHANVGVRLEVVRTRSGDELAMLCDVGLVHRALVNIIRNAVQAMTPEAHETTRRNCASASLRRLTIGAWRRNVVGTDGDCRDMVVLAVRDT